MPDYSGITGAEFLGTGFRGVEQYSYDRDQFMKYFDYLNSEGYKFSIEKSSGELMIVIRFGGWKSETMYYNPKQNQIQIL